MNLKNHCAIDLPEWVDGFVRDWEEPLETPQQRMALAIALSAENIAQETGGPFGAIVVEEADGRLLGVGVNRVMHSGLSLAHAEMVALSMAQAARGDWNLDAGPRVQLVSSCEPCAMCYGAVPWSGIGSLTWGASREDAEASGFDEGNKPENWRETLEARGIATQGDVLRDEAAAVLAQYIHSDGAVYHPEKR